MKVKGEIFIKVNVQKVHKAKLSVNFQNVETMKRSFASKIVCIVKHEATLSCIILSLKRSSDHAVSSVQKLDHPTM